jgi:hypothetical protein
VVYDLSNGKTGLWRHVFVCLGGNWPPDQPVGSGTGDPIMRCRLYAPVAWRSETA